MSKTDITMPTAFDPQAVEAGWYARWENEGLFVAAASVSVVLRIAAMRASTTGSVTFAGNPCAKRSATSRAAPSRIYSA